MKKKIFLPECEAILRNEIEGVDRVFIFDWKVSNSILHPSLTFAYLLS
jgi:hypothetical protein